MNTKLFIVMLVIGGTADACIRAQMDVELMTSNAIAADESRALAAEVRAMREQLQLAGRWRL